MKRRSGFSWTQWFVVVALLLLVPPCYVLLPQFFSRGTPISPRDVCQSNLKRIMLGVKQYTQDYDEKFPLLSANQLPATISPSSGWVCSLQPYLRSLQVFQCPSETNSEIGHTDYAYNASALAGHIERDFKSSNTVVLCEIDEAAGFLASASAPQVTNRHVEGANYAFVDGHVKWLRRAKAPAPSNVPATGSNFTFGR